MSGLRLPLDLPPGEGLRQAYQLQLASAMKDLAAGVPHGVHDVRKRVKKARALAFAARDARPAAASDEDTELKIANRSLGSLSDAHRLELTVEKLRGFDPPLLPDDVVEQLRAALRRRLAAFDDIALRDGTYDRAALLVRSAKDRAAEWRVEAVDAVSVGEAIHDAHQMAAHLRGEIRKRPTVEGYHRWRRRVKLEWYLFRIVSKVTGDRLADDRHRLAALDACLGELHDLHVLAAALSTESLLSRGAAAHAVRVVRARAGDLRRHADRLSAVLKDSPRQVADRLDALWGMDTRRAEQTKWPAIA